MTTALLVDIGNTSVTVGLSNGNRVHFVRRTPTKGSDRRIVRQCLCEAVGSGTVNRAVLCSVVPAATGLWEESLRRVTGCSPLIVSHKLNLGVRLKYPHPETLGADRLANVCGAAARYALPLIVADFGTATTFDVVCRDGCFIGGVIAPGPAMLLNCLTQGTALLPQVDLDGPIPALGRSTKSAMRIGAVVGFSGLTQEITRHLLNRCKIPGATLCATGGYARRVLRDVQMPYVLDMNLTLRGLSKIASLNDERWPSS